MVIIKLDKVKKYYADRLVLDIDDLEVLQGQRIGIVGENGAGKTTLIKVILGLEDIDEGKVTLNADYSYISQSNAGCGSCSNGKIRSILNAPENYNDFLSGGEKVKLAITSALQSNSNFLIADEPTANLDYSSIKSIEKLIKEYKGTLLLVSHDREFLNNLCTTILEIDNGHIKLYDGNYSKYLELKHEEEEHKKSEYEKYISEKQRLEKAITQKENHRDSIKKVPKRMGNSEARLHRKMGGQKAKRNLDGNIKALRSRINHLQEKEKPIKNNDFNISIIESQKLDSKNVITVNHLDLYIEDKLLIENVDFKIANGEKAALIGDNGCGKTTLIKEIINNTSDSIKLSNKISIGYFDQEQDILDDNKSIIHNIMQSSSYDENFIRLNLACFGFKGDSIRKNVGVLSGGEKVRIALCKVLLSDNNTLILDEPTNYLDVKSIEALEKAIVNTDKTVLIVSHDRSFISNVSTCIIEVKDKRAQFFKGSYKEFMDLKASIKLKNKENISTRKRKEELMLLENQLSQVLSNLSIEKDTKKKLSYDNEYKMLLTKIQKLRV